MPFAKMISPVKENMTKREFSDFFLIGRLPFFPLEYKKTQDFFLCIQRGRGGDIKLQIKKNCKNFLKTLFKVHKRE